MITFEAYEPSADNQTDCLYYIPRASIGTLAQAQPHRVPSSCSGVTTNGTNFIPLPSGSFVPDVMDPSVSSDGHYIAYTTYEFGWQTGTNPVVYHPVSVVHRFDTASATDEKVSNRDDGTEPYPPTNSGGHVGGVARASISASGEYISFQSTWQLTAAARAATGSDVGNAQIYVWESDAASITDVSSDTKSEYDKYFYDGSISPDGRFVAMVSNDTKGLDTANKPKGTHARAYLLDRDVDGNATHLDAAGNTKMTAVSDGTAIAEHTHVGQSLPDGSGGIQAGRVAWSEILTTAVANPSAMRLTPNAQSDPETGIDPNGVTPFSDPSAPAGKARLATSTAPPRTTPPSTTPKSTTTTSTTTVTTSTVTTSTVPKSATSTGSTTTLKPPDDPSITPNALHLDKGTAKVLQVNDRMGASALATQSTTPVLGGVLMRINVENMATGQVSPTVTSGSPSTDGRLSDDFGTRFSLSEDASEVAFGAVDASNTSTALARYVEFPWVGYGPSTFGPVPYNVFASDPVNVATGSFMQTAVDLPAPKGVYGLDWQRTYNSGNPAQSSIGVGWTPGLSSTVTLQGTSAVVTFDTAQQAIYPSNGSGGYTTPSGQVATLVQDGGGSWTLTFPSGEHWNYDSTGVLTSRTSPDGQSVSMSYSTTTGELASVTAKNSAGVQDGSLTLTYDSSGLQLQTVATGDGRSVTYNYANSGKFLYSVQDANQNTWHYTPDMLGRVVKITDPSGATVVENTYDDNGRVGQQTTQSGAVAQFTYDESSGNTAVKDLSTGESLSYQFDKAGNVLSIKDPGSNTATYTYTNGFPTLSKDRSGVKMGASYYPNGQIHTVSDPKASNTTTPGVTTYIYDSQNRVKSVTAPNQTATIYAYTGTRTVPDTVTVKDSGGTQVAQTAYIYNSQGQITQSTDPDGVVTTYSDYTDSGQPETVTVGGKTTHYTYYGSGLVHTVIDPMAYETDFTYNATGQVLTKVGPYASGDSEQLETVTTYDSQGRIKTVTGPAYMTDAVKPLTTYNYDPVTGLLSDLEGPNQEHTYYTYDADGNLKTVKDPDGNITKYGYGTLSRKTSEATPRGVVTKFGYDANGQQNSVVTPVGSTTTSTNNTNGQLATTVVSPTNPADPSPARTTSYTYDTYGRVATITNPAGALTTYNTYDAFNRPTKVTSPRGSFSTTSYTPSGKVHQSVDASGLVTTNTYNPVTGWLDKVTGPALASDANPPVTQYLYNDDGLKKQVTSPENEITKWDYDALGRVTTVTEPDGVITVNTWDARGNLTEQKRETNTADHSVYSSTSATYDLEGHMLTSKDAKSDITTFVYDDAGHRTKEIDPLHYGVTPAQYSEQWHYDADGNLDKYTDGLNRDTLYNWSATTGLLDSTSDPTGRSTAYGYDFAGEANSKQFSKGSTIDPATTYTYDQTGKPLTVTNPDGTDTLTYSTAGDLTQAITPGGRTTIFGYDTAGRRISQTDPDGQSYTYTYDQTGHVHDVTPDQVMTDTFTAPDGTGVDNSKWIFTTAKVKSNQANLALSATTATQGLLSAAPQSSDDDITLRYQFTDTTNPQTLRIIGRLIAGTGDYEVRINPTSTTAQVAKVDGAGNATNLAPLTVPIDTNPHEVRLQIQGDHIRAKIWDAGENQPSSWNVDTTDESYSGNGYIGVSDNQTGTATTGVLIDDYSETNPTTPPAAAATMTYDADGRPHSETLANGATRGWDYTNAELTGFTQTGVGTAINDTAQYDSVGRLHTLTNGSNTITYGYDTADELLSATGGTANLAYTYDADGQRQTTTIGSSSVTYHYDDAGQLHDATDGSTYSYDDAGRQLTANGPTSHVTYAYDDGGRLATDTVVTGSTTSSETRTYGPNDELAAVADTTGSTTTNTKLDWDPTAPTDSILDRVTTGSSGAAVTTDLTSLNGLATTTKGGTTKPIGEDYFGSVTATPGDTTLACSASYDPYGTPGATAPTTPCLGFRSALTSNGLTDLGARNYQANAGMFTSVDPASGSQGTPTISNHYTYANNNPINNADPTGTNSITDGGVTLGVFNSMCQSAGGRVFYYGNNFACSTPPKSMIDGAACFPSVTPDGHPYVLHNGNCEIETITTVCARGNSIPGATYICQHATGITQGLTIVAVGATVIATGGTAVAVLTEVGDTSAVAITGAAEATEGDTLTGADIMSEDVAQESGIDAPEPDMASPVGEDFDKINGILRDAAGREGNFGLGSATEAESNAAGDAWVGDGYRVASDGKSLVSEDELRVYRPPTWKTKLGQVQANFEWRSVAEGPMRGNGHLDIVD
jgi:RHS repeat-associated protein